MQVRILPGAPNQFIHVTIAHESPNAPYMIRAVDEAMRENPFGWSDRGIAYSTAVRAKLHDAYVAVAPTVLFHGHHHIHDIKSWFDETAGEWRSVVGLHKQRQHGNLVKLNFDDLTASVL